MSLDVSLLFRIWVHSQEEDSPGQKVYRPEGFDLPPSRGRAALAFQPDGAFTRSKIGANDIAVVSLGAWRILAADRLQIEEHGSSEQLRILSLSSDQLVIADPD